MQIEEKDFIDLVQAFFRGRYDKSEVIVREIAKKYGKELPEDIKYANRMEKK